MKKIKKIGKIFVIIIVILIFVMSYIDFGSISRRLANDPQPQIKNPTSSPPIVGPTTPPPTASQPTQQVKRSINPDLLFLGVTSTPN